MRTITQAARHPNHGPTHCSACAQPVDGDCQIDGEWFCLPCGCHDALFSNAAESPLTPEEIAAAWLIAEEY